MQPMIDAVRVSVGEMTAYRVRGKRKLPAALCLSVVNVHVLGRVSQLCASMVATNVGGRLRRRQSMFEISGTLARCQTHMY